MSEPLFPEPDVDVVPSFLPESDEPLTPEDEFAAFESSFETPTTPPDLVVQVEQPTPVGRGWAFDFNKRRFVSSPGGHGPLATYGEETLKTWIVKALQTARRAHPIYSDNYGIETPADYFSGPVAHFPTDQYHDAVREALLVNENIADVIDLRSRFDPDEEFIALSFIVVRANGSQLNINVSVGAPR